MKIIINILIFTCIFSSSYIFANEDLSSAFHKEPRPNEDRFVPGTQAQETRRQLDQLQDLEFFINLPEPKLNQIKMLIERISKMSDVEKEEIKAKMAKFKKLNLEKQEELYQKYKQMSSIDKYALWKHFSSMTPEERKKENEKFRNLTSEERNLHKENIIKKFKEENPDFEVPSDFTPKRMEKLSKKERNKKRPFEPLEKDILDSLDDEK